MLDENFDLIGENEEIENISEEISAISDEHEAYDDLTDDELTDELTNDDLTNDDLTDDDLTDDDLTDDELTDDELKNVDEPLNAPQKNNDSTTTFTGNSGNIMPAANAMPGTCNYVCTYAKAEYSWNTLCAVE